MRDVSNVSPQALHILESSGKEAKKSAKVERVTVRMSGDLGEAIRELENVTSATSPSEVVRRAIVVYHTLVKQKLAGNEPVIEIKDEGKERKVPIFL